MSKLNRYLPIFISLILVVILAMILAEITLTFLNKQQEQPVVGNPAQIDNKPIGTSQPENYASVINQANLFGKLPTNDAPKKEKVVEKVAPTRLNLKLHGTIAYDDNTGFAMISSAGKDQKTYAVGEQIENSGNTKLAEVYSTKVLLDVNGKKEELKLPEKKSMISRPAVVSANISDTLPPAGAMRGRPPELPSQIKAVDPNNLGNIRDQLLANPAALYKIMRVSPVTTDNKFQGYRVNPGKNQEAFTALGFEAGDVVTSVNGQVIDNPQRGMEIFKNMTTSDTVNVEVKRGEETVTLTGMF